MSLVALNKRDIGLHKWKKWLKRSEYKYNALSLETRFLGRKKNTLRVFVDNWSRLIMGRVSTPVSWMVRLSCVDTSQEARWVLYCWGVRWPRICSIFQVTTKQAPEHQAHLSHLSTLRQPLAGQLGKVSVFTERCSFLPLGIAFEGENLEGNGGFFTK